MLLFFPQMLVSSSSMAQYPIQRTDRNRTLINEMADGSTIRCSDNGAGQMAWDLSYSDLSAVEFAQLETLFGDCSGRWRGFTFLDPTANLIPWSADLDNSSWHKDPLLTVASAVPDILGGLGGWTVSNTSQGAQTIWQGVEAPAGFQYCWSVYLRAGQPSVVSLFSGDGIVETASACSVGPNWCRQVHSFRLESSAANLIIGLRLLQGQSIETYGFQLEAQLAPGALKLTKDRGGIYPGARFDQDVLINEASGVSQFNCKVKIVANALGLP